MLLQGEFRPVTPKSVRIPPGNGLRGYDDQSGRPARLGSAQGHPEDPVDIIEHRPWSFLFQSGHLLPQRQVPDQQFLASAKDGSEHMDAKCNQEDEETDHRRGVCLSRPAVSSPPLAIPSGLLLVRNHLILRTDE